MTWPLASFLLLALALAAGFAWYERSHPSARVLALVGTLAALAVLGRIAFAPIPNVKPTTDVVLLSGYVFGGAPGFAVGAVAALASNVFFAQGPWTPWQMAAWGTIGIAGAGLARISGGRLPRIPLALACGLAGLAYGVVVNFGSVATVGGGSGLLGRYLAYQATSLPWDLAHAGGNVAFFFLFGPGLVRTLRRFRTRLTFTWHPSTTGIAVALAALLVVGAATQAPAARAATPASYLARTQNADGGWGSERGRPSSPLFSGWAVMALAAERHHPYAVRRGAAYVRAHAHGLTGNGSATGAGDLERTILALRAAGQPARIGRQDLSRALVRRFGRDGAVLDQVNLTAFGILALRAAGVSPRSATLRRAGAWLASAQNRDGGFGFLGGIGSDVDDTAAAAQALEATGGQARALRRAARFLLGARNRDGGMGQGPGEASNAQSTAWAIQGLVAAGRARDAAAARAWLGSLVAPDGLVRYSRTNPQTPVWVTAEALLGLLERPLPVVPR